MFGPCPGLTPQAQEAIKDRLLGVLPVQPAPGDGVHLRCPMVVRDLDGARVASGEEGADSEVLVHVHRRGLPERDLPLRPDAREH